MEQGTYDVLVVGAGMAGLVCARRLAEQGQRVCVVEANDRVGGRILTTRQNVQVVEMGAEFVHGRPPELLALIEEAGLAVTERGGSQVRYEAGVLRSDSNSDDSRGSDHSDGRAGRLEPLERLRSFRGSDVSFHSFLKSLGDALSEAARAEALGYVEGFNAADASEISAAALGMQQRAEDSIEGDRVAHVTEGYDRLPQFLAERLRAAGGELRLGVRVSAVHWGDGRVALETSAGEMVAAKAVLTLPLGVLQAGVVKLVPEPRDLLAAAALMRMGAVCRFTLIFRERFWETLPPQPAMRELSFLFDAGGLPPVWWTTYPEHGRSLTGWVGGPRSLALLGKAADDLGAIGCRALARLFDVPEALVREQLEGCCTHDWSADETTCGAYSYVGVGGVEASRRMAEPVEHTLFFAGEHTDVSGHWGTVHGAMRSGLRAAEQVLDAGSAAGG